MLAYTWVREDAGTGAMFVGTQKKLPKKGENYIISDLSLIGNHYKMVEIQLYITTGYS